MCNICSIFLNIAADCSGSECVYVLRRFIFWYGVPSEIISDKGLRFDDKVIEQFLLVWNTKWTPSLKAAPWFGGFLRTISKIY